MNRNLAALFTLNVIYTAPLYISSKEEQVVTSQATVKYRDDEEMMKNDDPPLEECKMPILD